MDIGKIYYGSVVLGKRWGCVLAPSEITFKPWKRTEQGNM